MTSEQECFWAGEFGNDYTARNCGDKIVENNIDFFSNALTKCGEIKSILEIGCNNGMNLMALEYIMPFATKTGIDVNAQALYDLSNNFEIRELDQPKTYKEGILGFSPKKVNDDCSVEQETYELVVTKGLLIHCSPDHMCEIYEKLYTLTSRYILIAEYYNPTPVSIPYRGYGNKLFKRDFAGEMLAKYSDLKLIDYGFVYHLDKYPQDDVTWFLLGK